MKTEIRPAKIGERVLAVRDCIFGDFHKGDKGTVIENGWINKSTVHAQIDGQMYDEAEGAIMTLIEYEVIIEE